MLIFTNDEEKLLINSHLISLMINDYNTSIYQHELPEFWKNWFQIYKDYKYTIQISSPIINKCNDNCCRFDVINNNDKYNGLLFVEYFHYVLNWDYFIIKPSNNTYVCQSGIIDKSIQGNEKYEVIINIV